MIVDDHQLVLDGIKSTLAKEPSFEVKAEAHNGKEALELAQRLQLDVVLMDIDMPVMNGFEATQELIEKFPGIKVLVLTMHNEKGIINKMLEIGASGFILKNTDKDTLILAIKKVAAGERYFSSEVTMTLFEKKSVQLENEKSPVASDLLTTREVEILKLIASGLSNREIGEKLFISPRTVDTHRTNLMEKIEVKNIAGLIRFALTNGYLD